MEGPHGGSATFFSPVQRSRLCQSFVRAVSDVGMWGHRDDTGLEDELGAAHFRSICPSKSRWLVLRIKTSLNDCDRMEL